MEAFVISSKLIIEEAKKMWIDYEILLENKNIFILKKWTKEILFKAIDCWLNSSFSYKIAKDKELTYLLWERYWFSVPKSLYVSKKNMNNIDYNNLKFPLVSKPVDWAHGSWVAMNLSNKIDIEEWIKYSFESGKVRKVILQEQIFWDDYRILVVWDKIIAWAKRIPPYIIWDWKSSILDLINIENENPFRWKWGNHDAPMSKIKIDEDSKKTLKKEWLTLDSILEKNRKVFVRSNCNLSTWWLAIDITDFISNDIKESCVKFCKILGLKVAGVDVLTSDISKTLEETNWAIIEINATPSIRMHHFPSEWKPRNVAKEIIKLAFNM